MDHASTLHALPTISAPELLAREDAVVIDLRSPAEFAEDHVPGARNVPLLDDLERALVGRLYKRVSPQAAFESARDSVAAKLEGLVRELCACAGAELPERAPEAIFTALTAGGVAGLEAALARTESGSVPDSPVVLHCWRGGMRSRSVVALLRELGLDRAVGLEGGYKGYRKSVLRQLERWQSQPGFVLRGMTGVGKTLVLREIERLRPGWTIDLEGLARHRSSILGGVGLEPVSQKTFDSRLAQRLRAGLPAAPVFEGESRKVGDVIVPASVWSAMNASASIELRASTARRVEVLMADYLEREEARDELRARLPFIERRLGPVKWAGVLVELFDARREPELVELLLEHYYDPLYRHSGARHTIDVEIDAEDAGRAAREVVAWIEARPAQRR